VEATIQMIFLLGYAAYDKMYRLPDHFRKAGVFSVSVRAIDFKL
jgi:hypothetical protein